MARIYLGLLWISPSHPRPTSSVSVSIIIATNKRPEVMAGLLEDLAIQNYSHDVYEVIVADDSSGKWPAEMSDKWPELPGFKIVKNPGTGKKQALNEAIKAAKGELIITTDDDCRVGADWVLAIASHYSRFKPGMIICPVELEDSNSFFGRMQQLEFFSLQGATAGAASAGDPLMCNGAGLAFRRDLYPGAGALNAGSLPSGDDTFLLHYLKKRNVKIDWIESNSAVVTTGAAKGVTDFFRQRSRWASKSLFYTDPSTVITGVSVMTACIITGACLVLSFINPGYLKTAFVLLMVKSIPDSLIIMNRLRFHGKTDLLGYFPVVQLLYPFYVITAAAIGLFRTRRW